MKCEAPREKTLLLVQAGRVDYELHVSGRVVRMFLLLQELFIFSIDDLHIFEFYLVTCTLKV